MQQLTLKLINAYQGLFSRGILRIILAGGWCRFYPSCSEYTYQAIEKYGILKGSFLGIKRIFHCHPFSLAGYDPLK